MKTSKRGYAMAMLSGLAIIGAATAGVSVAESHQATVAAEIPAAPTIPVIPPSSDQAPTDAPSASQPATSAAATDSGSAAVSPTVAATSSGGGSRPPAPTTPTKATGSAVADSTAPQRTTATSPAPVTTSAPPKPVAHLFKDGQYSATGMYNSPGGTQHLGVTITVAADKVAAAKLDLLGNPGIAHSYQTLFASGYSAQVVGKDIASIKLGAIAGSSLTGMGFNMALQQIESQAHA